jgi:hypothetical protein
MTGFIDSLVDRFSGADNIITPRLSGWFEPAFPDQLNQFGESTTENETTTVLNEMSNMSSLKDTGLGFFDNNKYYKDQLSRDGNIDHSSIEKRRPTAVDPVNNEISSNSQQQVNNTFIKTFIQPPGINNESQVSFQFETKNDLKETPSSDIGDNAMNHDFLDHQLEKERQRNKIDKSQSFPVRSEQYSMINKKVGHPDFYEQSQSNKTPVIKISIGRIEVRAVPVSNGVKVKDSSPQKPRLTLDEYLQKRNSRQ